MINIQFLHGSFYGTWIRSEKDIGYIVRVTDGNTLLTEKRILPDDLDIEKGILLYTPETLCEGKEYRFDMEVITENISCSAKIPQFSELLERLKENILSNLTANGSQVLNAGTLENESLVLLMKEHLGCTELTIQKPKDPVLSLNERSLDLEGENVQVRLFMDEKLDLQMTALFLTTLPDLFKNTVLEEYIEVTPVGLYLSSFSHIINENMKLERGLNFFGEIKLPVELNYESEKTQMIPFSGLMRQDGDDVCFEGINRKPLPSFFLIGADQRRYELKEPAFFTSVSKNKASAYLEGSMVYNENSYIVRILLPADHSVHAAYADPQSLFPTIDLALSYIEGESQHYFLPANIRGLASVTVRSAGFVFSPEYSDNMYYLQIGGNNSPLSLLPQKLELTDWSLMLRRIEYWRDEYKNIHYAALLSGTFLIADEKTVKLEASVSENTNWQINMECEDGNWLKALANLAGFSIDAFSDQLPFLWKGTEKISFEHACLQYDAAKQTITSLEFYMFMKETWEIIPSAFALEDIEIAVQLTHHAKWDYHLRVNGAVRIGSGDNAATIFVALPISQNMTTLTFKSGIKGAAIPSFEDLFKLVGAGNGSEAIPADFLNMDGLRINLFEVTIGLVPSNCLESFAFGVTTQKNYQLTLTENLTFTVKELGIQLDYKKNTPMRFIGNGIFSLFGIETAVQIQLSENKSPILFAVLQREKAEKISFRDMADSFTDTKENKYDSLPIPEHFHQPVFEEASVYIDKENELYLMSGQISSLGSALFFSAKQDTERGYLLAAALDSNFTFAMISQSLAILDSYLKIQKAGFLLSSLHDYRIADITANLPVKIQGAEAVIPKELPPYDGKLQEGIFLYGTIAFTAPVFSNLIRLGSDSGELVLETYAYLPKREETTEIHAKINEFLLLGIFHFKDISLCYCMQREKQFDLNGTLSIQIGKQSLDFQGAMHVGETESHFSVQTKQNLLEPIGLSGLDLKDVTAKMTILFPQESQGETTYDLHIGGTVKIGPAELKGELLLQNQSVKVYSITLNAPLNIDELFSAVFTSKIWPAGLLNLTVNEGIFYKAEENCRIGQTEYKKGIHIKSTLTIYDFSFAIEGFFGRNAFEISGLSQKEISLGFISITGTRGNAGCGIKFKANDSEKTLGFTGGIKLFGDRVADIDLLGYDIGRRCFKGSIRYGGELELFKDAKISFTWSKESGIEIEEFPMQFVDQALDFAKLLEEASKAGRGGCGKLTGLMFDKVVQTKFECKPSFGSITDDGMIIELEPQYRIFVFKQEITAASMKKISVTVPTPNEFGLGALAELIIKTILDNALSIAGQILDDREGMMKLITAIGAVTGTETAFRTLVCLGAKETLSVTAQAGQAAQLSQSAQGFAMDGLLGEAVGAASSAGAAAAGAQSSYETSIAYFAALLAGFIFAEGFSKSRKDAEDHKKNAESKADELTKTEQNARNAVEGMLVIRNLESEETGSGKLMVYWEKIPSEDLDLSYQVTVEKNGVVSLKTRQKDTRLEISFDPGMETTIHIDVYASLTYPKDGKNYVYDGEHAHFTKTYGQPLKLSMEKMPDAKAGEPYRLAISVQGGSAPYHYDVHGLPSGLSVQDGVITGIPHIGGGEVLIDIIITDALQMSVKRSYWLAVK